MKRYLYAVIATFLILSLGGCKEKPTTNLSNFPVVQSINYNNYQGLNKFDAKQDISVLIKDCFFFSMMFIYNNGKKAASVKAPAYELTQCQIGEDEVYYINDYVLYSIDINTKEIKTVKENVIDFVLYKDMIIYTGLEGDRRAEMVILKNETEVAKIDDVSSYIVSGDYLYYFYYMECVIGRFNLTSAEDEGIIGEVPVAGYPYCFNMVGDKAVFEYNLKIFVFDTITGEMNETEMPFDTWCNTAINSDDNYVYLMYQRKKRTKFSVPVDDENNGVWKINIETGEKVKITDETFDQLYLFDDVIYGFDEYKGLRL